MNGRARTSLELMITRVCSLRCSYCLVDKAPRSMSVEVLRRAISLLFTAPGEVHLLFFGGEPLARADLVLEGLRFSQSLARENRKDVRYSLATNGLALDERLADAFPPRLEVLLSLDGARDTQERHWPGLPAAGRAYSQALGALRLLQRRGVPHIVFMVVEPGDVESMSANIAFLREAGVERLHVAHRQGVLWDERAAGRFLEEIGLLLEAPAGFQLLNAQDAIDPILLHDDVLVDCDGTLVWWSGIFLEEGFPAVKRACRIGRLDDFDRLEQVEGSAEAVGRLLLGAYAAGSNKGRILRNNLELGRRLRALCASRAGEPTPPSESSSPKGRKGPSPRSGRAAGAGARDGIPGASRRARGR